MNTLCDDPEGALMMMKASLPRKIEKPEIAESSESPPTKSGVKSGADNASTVNDNNEMIRASSIAAVMRNDTATTATFFDDVKASDFFRSFGMQLIHTLMSSNPPPKASSSTKKDKTCDKAKTSVHEPNHLTKLYTMLQELTMRHHNKNQLVIFATEYICNNVNIQDRSVNYSYISLYSFLVMDAYFAQVSIEQIAVYMDSCIQPLKTTQNYTQPSNISASDASDKVRNLCQMKLPYNKPTKKKGVSELVVGRDETISTSSVTIDTFIPNGKVEEKWFKNFKKWNNSNATAASSSPIPKNWVQEQRTHYRLLQQNKKTQMTHDRATLLESGGFRWKKTYVRKRKAVSNNEELAAAINTAINQQPSALEHTSLEDFKAEV